MIRDDPMIKPPEDPQIKIWRYMDFTKFVAMLEYGGLFFSRADRLGDPFEGSHPQADVELRRRIFESRGWSREKIEQAMSSVSSSMRTAPSSVLVNCWHMNEHESAAMWKLYTQTKESICIQSTYQRLHDGLQPVDDQVYIGVVKYIDYNSDLVPDGRVFGPFIYKRRSFEHERELRAFIWAINDASPSELGKWLTLDLGKLIERIHVAPSSSPWFRDLVKKVARRYCLEKEVRQSDMDSTPMW